MFAVCGFNEQLGTISLELHNNYPHILHLIFLLFVPIKFSQPYVLSISQSFYLVKFLPKTFLDFDNEKSSSTAFKKVPKSIIK